LDLSLDRVNKFSKIQAKVSLIKKSLGVEANFIINFSAELICSRCLKLFLRNFNEKYHLEYIEGKDPLLALSRVELKSGDIDRVYFTGNTIDISIGIRESIILSIPTVPLCKENCRGLCPVCGIDLNTNSCNCKIIKPNLFQPMSRR